MNQAYCFQLPGGPENTDPQFNYGLTWWFFHKKSDLNGVECTKKRATQKPGYTGGKAGGTVLGSKGDSKGYDVTYPDYGGKNTTPGKCPNGKKIRKYFRLAMWVLAPPPNKRYWTWKGEKYYHVNHWPWNNNKDDWKPNVPLDGYEIRAKTYPVHGHTYKPGEDEDIIEGPSYWTNTKGDPTSMFPDDYPPNWKSDHWVNPLRAHETIPGRWYRIRSLLSPISEELDNEGHEAPYHRAFWTNKAAIDAPQQIDDAEIESAFVPGMLVPRGTERYMQAQDERLIFGAFGHDRPREDMWTPKGEPWTEMTLLKSEPGGPRYWTNPNGLKNIFGFNEIDLFTEYWQKPYSYFSPRKERGTVIRIKATKDVPIKTRCHLLQARNGAVSVNPYLSEEQYREYIGNYEFTGDDVVDGIAITERHWHMSVDSLPPTRDLADGEEGMIVCVRSQEWLFSDQVEGDTQINTFPSLGARYGYKLTKLNRALDSNDGPVYWGDGYPAHGKFWCDWHDQYWNLDLNAKLRSDEPDEPLFVTGQRYTFTPDPDLDYDMKIVWVNFFGALTPWDNLAPNEYNYFQDVEGEENIIRAGGGPVTVEATGNYCLFVASSSAGKTPLKKHDFSVNGMPLKCKVLKEVLPEGPLYWGQDGQIIDNFYEPIFEANDKWERPLRLANDFESQSLNEDTIGDYVLPRVTEGQRYEFARNAFTPKHGFAIHWVKQRRDVDRDEPVYITDVNKFTRTTDKLELVAQGDYFFFTAFDIQPGDLEDGSDQKTRETWSPLGEPIDYMFRHIPEPKAISGTMYWTDDPLISPENKWRILKDQFWTRTADSSKGLNPTAFDENPDVFNADAMKEGKTYDFTILSEDSDGNQINPEYRYQLWFGPHPNAIETNLPCTYIQGPTMLRGETVRIKMEARCLIIGAYQTDRSKIEDWNKDGEPVYVAWTIYNEPETRGPAYYADGIDDPDNWPYFDVNGRWQEHNPFGEQAFEQQLQLGTRYRATPYLPTMQGPPGQPEIPLYDRVPPPQNGSRPPVLMPYDYQFWFTNSKDALDPEKGVAKAQWTRGPALRRDRMSLDFEMTHRNLLFGAFNTGTGGETRRYYDDWNKLGEPCNFTIEELVETAGMLEGPSYFTEREQDLPDFTTDHFWKPINYINVPQGADQIIVNPVKTGSNPFTTGKAIIWWILDPRDRRFGGEFPIDGTQPDYYVDINGNYVVRANGELYLKGEVINPGDTDILIEVESPRAFIAAYNQTGFNRQEDWSPKGHPALLTFDPVGDGDPENYGPLYWGDTPGGNVKHAFTNRYWKDPLNVVEGRNWKSGTTYKVRRRDEVYPSGNNDFQDYTDVKLWAVNPNRDNALHPGINFSKDFHYLGNFNKDQTEIVIDIPSNIGETIEVIYSCQGVSRANKAISGWNPYGEPDIFVFEKFTEPKGPVYWSDTKAGSWEAGFPQFSDSSKWFNPLNALQLSKGNMYEVELLQDADKTYVFWWFDDVKGLNPNTANRNMYSLGSEFLKGQKKGAKQTVEAQGKYLLFGTKSSGRTKDDWSRKGEEHPFRFKITGQNKGPSYWASKHRGPPVTHSTAASRWEVNWTDRKWKYRSPITPILRPTFKSTRTYIFGITPDVLCPLFPTAETPNNRWNLSFDLYCSQARQPTQATTTYVCSLGQGYSPVTSWRPVPGNFIWAAAYSNKECNRATDNNGITAHTRDSEHGMKTYENWSPKGEPLHVIAIRKVKLPNSIAGWIALAILLALMLIWAYFSRVAKIDHLFQCNEERHFNEYPIHRWKRKYTDGVPSGYNHPNEEQLYGTGSMVTYYLTQYVSGPRAVFFNYTVDEMNRYIIRLLAMRHNGYLVHYHKASSSTDAWEKNTSLHMYNWAPTTMSGYKEMSGKALNGNKFRRIPQYYDPLEKNYDPVKWSVFRPDAAKSYRIDDRINDAIESESYDRRNRWFEPGLWYPLCSQPQTDVVTSGERWLKTGYTCTDGGKLMTRACDKTLVGPSYYLENIFTKTGWSFNHTGDIFSAKNSKAFAFEITNSALNGWTVRDEDDNKTESEVYYTGHWGLDFDLTSLKLDTTAYDQWQLIRVFINTCTISNCENGRCVSNRKSYVMSMIKGEDYVLRESGKGESGVTKYGQVKDTPRTLRMATDKTISPGEKFHSLTFYFYYKEYTNSDYAGGNSISKKINISNLTNRFYRDSPF